MRSSFWRDFLVLLIATVAYLLIGMCITHNAGAACQRSIDLNIERDHTYAEAGTVLIVPIVSPTQPLGRPAIYLLVDGQEVAWDVKSSDGWLLEWHISESDNGPHALAGIIREDRCDTYTSPLTPVWVAIGTEPPPEECEECETCEVCEDPPPPTGAPCVQWLEYDGGENDVGFGLVKDGQLHAVNARPFAGHTPLWVGLSYRWKERQLWWGELSSAPFLFKCDHDARLGAEWVLIANHLTATDPPVVTEKVFRSTVVKPTAQEVAP